MCVFCLTFARQIWFISKIMVNRALIRLKVVQIVYAYCQNGGQKPESAARDLSLSLSGSQELYHTLLHLLAEVYRHSGAVVSRKERFSPETLHASERHFSQNLFLAQLASNAELQQFADGEDFSWVTQTGLVRTLYAKVLEADALADYMAEGKFDWEADRDLARKLYKAVFIDNDELDAALEEQNIYWVADKELTDSFIQKTFKMFRQENGADQPLLGQYGDPEDEQYAKDLLDNALLGQERYRELIASHTRGWEAGRLAMMDVIVLQVAMAEIFGVPGIPVKVSINEYVDLAKYFSTPGSGSFVNGVLDAVAKEAVKAGELEKEY